MIIGVTSYLLTGYVETQSLDQSYQHTGQGFSNLSVRTDQVFCSDMFVGDFLIFWLLMKKVQVSVLMLGCDWKHGTNTVNVLFCF